ncbi:XrtA/PEP-CTERM system TPR-repeat protein PrsT [Flocculibacter collagenilyticus]|uniref:XrtA/PEP-CTERM system TPR-repeat protein PrsT n=1 Tax=Flocculibacter collagenilyticus TaxID=2744479 RepID=UPI0018F30E0E|nr:XrtA/PEP-CTERM system TPR-repeat protein PrsT [Flocculibacter collagenilyticus]
MFSRRFIRSSLLGFWLGFCSTISFSLISIPVANAQASQATTNISSEHYEKALSAFNKEDYDVSFIHLKNALKDNPSHLPAKVLYGRLLLKNAYYEEAVEEFKEALKQGADINLVLHPLGNALILLRKFEEILQLDNPANLTKSNQFELLMLKAEANAALKNTNEAEQSFKAALKLYPDNVRALNGLAWFYISNKQIPLANALIENAIIKTPNNARTWHLKGQLAQYQKDTSTALKHFKQAYQLDSKDPVIMRSLANTYFENGNFLEAKTIADSILTQTPDDPHTLLLLSRIALELDDQDEATRIKEKLTTQLANYSDAKFQENNELLVVSAILSFANNNTEKARTDLNNYLQNNPNDLNAVSLLASVFIAQEQDAKAIQLLEKYASVVKQDVSLSAKLVNLYLKNNKQYRANIIVDDLLAANPNNKEVLVLASKVYFSGQQYNKAIQILEQSSNSESDAFLMLVKGMIYVETGKYEQALQLSEKLLAVDSAQIDFLNLQAASLIKLNRNSEAQEAVTKILNQEPDNFAAQFNQANLYIKSQKYADGKKVLEKLLDERAKHTQSTFMLAIAEFGLNNYNDAISHLESLHIAQPKNLKVLEQLVNYYTEVKRDEDVLKTISKLERLNFLEPNYIFKRANILIKQGEILKAKEQLNILLPLWRTQPEKLLSLALKQKQIGDFEGAKDSLNKAIKEKPESLIYPLELVKLLLETNKLDEASVQLDKLTISHQNDPNVMMLKGDLAVKNEALSTAHDWYVKALSEDSQFTLIAIKLYQLAKQGIKEKEFVNLVKKMLEQQPARINDKKIEQHYSILKRVLADHFINANQPNKALPYYEQLTKTEMFKNDPMLYNNLANLYLEKQPQLALETINKIPPSQSNTAHILDTKGWILTKLNRFEEALTLLRQASVMDSTNASILYHLGYTLVKLNRIEDAKVELNKALEVAENEKEQARLTKLLESL